MEGTQRFGHVHTVWLLWFAMSIGGSLISSWKLATAGAEASLALRWLMLCVVAAVALLTNRWLNSTEFDLAGVQVIVRRWGATTAVCLNEVESVNVPFALAAWPQQVALRTTDGRHIRCPYWHGGTVHRPRQLSILDQLFSAAGCEIKRLEPSISPLRGSDSHGSLS